VGILDLLRAEWDEFLFTRRQTQRNVLCDNVCRNTYIIIGSRYKPKTSRNTSMISCSVA
jgi:hypothetical protein